MSELANARRAFEAERAAALPIAVAGLWPLPAGAPVAEAAGPMVMAEVAAGPPPEGAILLDWAYVGEEPIEVVD